MADLVNVVYAGQCRLKRNSDTEVQLNRYRGKYISLKIGSNWEAKIIPSPGPTISNSGLAADTLHYVYAFDSSGTLTLEISTTGHATDADTGVEIKSGDATRSLVGMLRTGAGSPGIFVDSTTRRLLRNWFNREMAFAENRFTANRATTSATFVELNTEIRVDLLCWADERIRAEMSGVVNASTSTGYSRIGEGATPTYINGGTAETVAGSGHHMNHSHGGVHQVAEGYHFYSLYGRTDAAASHSWLGGTDTAEAVVKLRAWIEQE